MPAAAIFGAATRACGAKRCCCGHRSWCVVAGGRGVCSVVSFYSHPIRRLSCWSIALPPPPGHARASLSRLGGAGTSYPCFFSTRRQTPRRREWPQSVRERPRIETQKNVGTENRTQVATEHITNATTWRTNHYTMPTSIWKLYSNGKYMNVCLFMQCRVFLHGSRRLPPHLALAWPGFLSWRLALHVVNKYEGG